jgi:hypothetical protein
VPQDLIKDHFYGLEDGLHLAQQKWIRRFLPGSTVANQAFTPYNIHKTRLFWTLGGVTGVFGVPRHRLLDTGECGLNLTSACKKIGHAVKGA